MEFVMIIVVGSGVVVTGLGLIRLWWKNGREADRRDGILGAQLKVLDTKLEGIFLTQKETRNDIAYLRSDVGEQKVHCASVTSGFAEKIKSLERRRK